MTSVNEEGYTLEQGLASVGNGWADIVRMAFQLKPSYAKIVQVKEKFGGLRIYADYEYPDSQYQKQLQLLEGLSYITCEWCGKPGTMDYRYPWILTLCEQCKRKRKRKKDKG